MEYLLGTLVGIIFASIFIIAKNKLVLKNKPMSVQYSQSYIFNLIRPAILLMKMIGPVAAIPTQSRKHLLKNQQRIVFTDGQAYWIQDNTFYVAEAIDNKIDEKTKKAVDIMGMDAVELDKMIFIVQKLTEGIQNDDRNSR